MGQQKVSLYRCPNCGGDLAIIEVLEGITTAGTLLGSSFVKCRNGCSKRKILDSAGVRVSRPVLPDSMFLEVVEYARSIGKRISTPDKNRELAIKMRLKRVPN